MSAWMLRLRVRFLTSLAAVLVVGLATGCGGAVSYPETRGYSAGQVARVFKAHGLVLVHVPALENRSGIAKHLRAVLRSAEAGFVVVFIYKSSKEAHVAKTSFGQQYSVKQRRIYRSVLVVNVLATVVVADRADSRTLKRTKAAMADLRRI